MESIKIHAYPAAGRGWIVALEIRSWVPGAPRGRVVGRRPVAHLDIAESVGASQVADLIHEALIELVPRD